MLLNLDKARVQTIEFAMSRPVDPERRREMIAAAAGLFRHHGFERTTVRDIARAVGVQSGSIFYHFSNKEEVLVAVMLEGLQQFADAARAPLQDARTPKEKLRALFIGHLTALHGGGDEQAVVISEMRSLSPQARRRVVRLRDRVEGAWRKVLEEAEAAELVRGDLRLLRLAMLGTINWTLQWYRKEGTQDIQELADSLLEVFVPGALSVPRPQQRGLCRKV